MTTILFLYIYEKTDGSYSSKVFAGSGPGTDTSSLPSHDTNTTAEQSHGFGQADDRSQKDGIKLIIYLLTKLLCGC